IFASFHLLLVTFERKVYKISGLIFKMADELLIEAKEFIEYQKKEIAKEVKKGKKSIAIPFSSILEFSHKLADKLLERPEETLAMLGFVLDELGFGKGLKIRLTELPKSQEVMIREIRSHHIGKLLSIEGIVRQSSDVRPQVTNALFECPSCGAKISILQLEKRFREPGKCSNCGRKKGFKLIARELVDAQRIVIEENPESLIGGEQPRRISVFLKEDLVEPKMEEKTTPGSRVKVIGILKELPIPLRSGALSTRYDLIIEANNIIPLEESFEELEISEEEEKEIKEIAARPDRLKLIAESIAPSVYGYEEIKQALALQLFSGVRKRKVDGTYTRGDIHILLVGDPGVAKSVILKFISSIAPRGRYVVGKAATGAGITATVVKDEFLSGWSLEAGAMVLANKGIICLDELEKMSEQDRSAMHEGMEQQTITISKANVQATLRAETSVLAAANPKFGRFDPYQHIAQQIDLPPTLINRFDLIFVLRDIPEREKDALIAEHVLKEHKRASKKPPIPPELLRKYIAYAKQKIVPKLTDEAEEEIKNFYVNLRSMPSGGDELVKPIPISARQLEALIRLSEASAKTRLSNKVTAEDARIAINLLKFSLLQVGLDQETGQIDIDRITTGIPASQRAKIILIRETINRLESRLGKMIPIKELIKEVEDKISTDEVYEIIEKLKMTGDIFEPKKGFIQKTT
ncbi:MAG: minichromosome maintenance protein MCM, partial [Candidatus Pacearchaeota archaeon]